MVGGAVIMSKGEGSGASAGGAAGSGGAAAAEASATWADGEAVPERHGSVKFEDYLRNLHEKKLREAGGEAAVEQDRVEAEKRKKEQKWQPPVRQKLARSAVVLKKEQGL